MSSIINWFAGLLGDSIVSITGGSITLMIIFGIIGMALVFWRLNLSMPFALMASFFIIGILSQTLNNPFDPVINSGETGLTMMIYLMLAFGTGMLLWHFFFKKSQAGVG